MRLSPLALTILLALLIGAVAIGAWVLFSADFRPPATPGEALNNATAANLTNYTAMARYMPMPPDGWAVNNTTGSAIDNYDESFSYAWSDYVHPGSNATVSVIIYDCGGHEILWNGIFKTGFIYSRDDGYAKTYLYKGLLAWETARYGANGNDYSLYIMLDHRYGVAILLKNATGRSPVGEFIDRTNIYGIVKLGRN